MEIAVESPEILTVPAIDESQNSIKNRGEVEIKDTPLPVVTISSEPKVSALSLASIRAKRELQETNKSNVKETIHLPTEPFTETDMLLHWNKYAQKLGDKGYKIMESLLSINDPVLNGTTITLELPNEGSKIDFESEINGLLGHLKGHLHNHDITINVVVNESIENKFAFTAQDKYNRLNEINPSLELLRKTFDLDL
jgi:hypothetical protein